MSEATKTPSILGALIARLTEGSGMDNPIIGAIQGIGATMAAAGVSVSKSAPGPADLGGLSLDLSLPVAIASAQAVDGGRQIG